MKTTANELLLNLNDKQVMIKRRKTRDCRGGSSHLKGGFPTQNKKGCVFPSLCPNSNALSVNLKGGSNPRNPPVWIHWLNNDDTVLISFTNASEHYRSDSSDHLVIILWHVSSFLITNSNPSAHPNHFKHTRRVFMLIF